MSRHISAVFCTFLRWCGIGQKVGRRHHSADPLKSRARRALFTRALHSLAIVLWYRHGILDLYRPASYFGNPNLEFKPVSAPWVPVLRFTLFTPIPLSNMDAPFTQEPLRKGWRYCWCPKCKGKAVSRKTFNRHGQISQPSEASTTLAPLGLGSQCPQQPQASSSRTFFGGAESTPAPASSTPPPPEFQSAAPTPMHVNPSASVSASATASANPSRGGSAHPSFPPPSEEGGDSDPDLNLGEDSTGRGESRKRAISDDEIDASLKRARENSPNDGDIDGDHLMEYQDKVWD